MKQHEKCPEVDELRHLLDGTLSGERQKVCADHMDTCQCCQTKLEGIATEGTNLSSVIEHLHESDPPATSGYWAAVQALDAAVDETFVPQTIVRRREASLEFLEPASDSAYIGRLSHFDVMRVLGRGGMGLVLEAFDTHLQRNVALKVLDPELAGDDVARQRFCREARAAASVTHENVVAVHNVEKSGEQGLPYLVMQLIAGESLEQRLARDKTLPLREIVRISMQVARGLGAAYAQGLIHRDIKPGNILLEGPHQSVRLTDFGLARAVDDVRLTRTGFVSGTPLYMAPEQAMGEEADHRSDLFSLGAIMYEMCTGQPPFDGNSALLILKQITDAKHRPVREVNPKIPEWFAKTVDGLLEKKPEDRIQSATHLAELLEFELALMKTSEDIPTVCKIEEGKRNRRNRIIGAAIGVGFLSIGLLAGLLIARRPNSTDHPTTDANQAAVLPADPKTSAVSGPPPIAVLAAKQGGTVWSVDIDNNSQLVAMGTEDGAIRLWDVSTNTVKSTFKAHRSAVWGARFTQNGEMLATAGDDGLIKLWKLSSTEPVKTFKHPSGIRGLALSQDGQKIYAGDREGNLKIWPVDGDQPLAEASLPNYAIYSIALSPDDETLATTGNNNEVQLWNAKSLTLKLPLNGHSGPVYGVAFNHDGKLLATVGWDKQVRIWEAGTGQLVKSWDGSSNDLWGVAFSHCGRLLATSGHDGAVKLWNPETGEQLHTYLGHNVAVHTLTFNDDGRMLVTGGRDGAVRVWKWRDTSHTDLEPEICAFTRAFTGPWPTWQTLANVPVL